MKKLYLIGLLTVGVTISTRLNAQQSVAIGTTNTDKDAVLLLVDNEKQKLIIPVTSSIPNMPVTTGMVVYNSGDKKVYYCDGTNWAPISGGAGGTDSQTLAISG